MDNSRNSVNLRITYVLYVYTGNQLESGTDTHGNVIGRKRPISRQTSRSVYCTSPQLKI